MKIAKVLLISIGLIFEILVFGVLVVLGCKTIGAVKSIIIAIICAIISIASMYYINRWLQKK